MSLTNRNETRLLVENWRKVLEEGLHDKDPELLEEGWKQNVLLATLLTQGLFGIIPQGISKAEATPITHADGYEGSVEAVEQMLIGKGHTVFEDEIYQLNKPLVKKQVINCIRHAKEQTTLYINQNDVLRNWFDNVALVHKKHSTTKTTGFEGFKLSEEFAQSYAKDLCLNYYEYIISKMPNVKTEIFTTDDEKIDYGVTYLSSLVNKEKPSAKKVAKTLTKVKSTYTHQDAAAWVFDGTKIGSLKVFRYISRTSPKSIKAAVKNFFELQFGGEELLINKLEEETNNSSIFKVLKGMFD